MTNPAKTAQQIKSQITRFSGKVSQELDKPKRRFINEMICGIQASKDVKLANIARAIDDIIKVIGKKGVWAPDRGGDRWKLFVPILERKLKFVVRMMSLRDMIDAEKRVRNIAAIARSTRCSKRAEVTIHSKGEPVRKQYG